MAGQHPGPSTLTPKESQAHPMAAPATQAGPLGCAWRGQCLRHIPPQGIPSWGSDGVIRAPGSHPPQPPTRLSCPQGLRKGTSGPDCGPLVTSAVDLGPSQDDSQGFATSQPFRPPLSLGPPPHQERSLGPIVVKGPCRSQVGEWGPTLLSGCSQAVPAPPLAGARVQPDKDGLLFYIKKSIIPSDVPVIGREVHRHQLAVGREQGQGL